MLQKVNYEESGKISQEVKMLKVLKMDQLLNDCTLEVALNLETFSCAL